MTATPKARRDQIGWGWFLVVTSLLIANVQAGERFPSKTLPGHVRIVSWNIERVGIRQPSRTTAQYAALARRILSFDAAVFALQEIDSLSVFRFVRSELGPTWRTFGSSKNPLLYDASRVEPLALDLDDDPTYPGSFGDRPVTGVFRSTLGDKNAFRIFSVHLSNNNSFVREAEGTWFRERVNELLKESFEPRAMFVMGDFNAGPGLGPHTTMGVDPTLTFLPKDNFSSTRPFGGPELDHVYATTDGLARLPEPTVFVILPAHYGETDSEFDATFSDHLPIFIDYFALSGSPPDAAFTLSLEEGTAPLTIEADAEPSRANAKNALASFTWDFGDGRTAFGQRATHVYRHSGIYSVRLTVTDERGAGACASRRVFVAPGANDVSPWTGADVGEGERSGLSGFENGCLGALQRQGELDRDDRFHFVHQELDGDGAVTARVSDLVSSEAPALVGVILRESLEPGARQFAVTVEERPFAVPVLRFRNRREVEAPTRASAGPPMRKPEVWLRIARQGDDFTGSWSQDGEAWFEMGSVTVVLPETLLGGALVAGAAARICSLAISSGVPAFRRGDCDGDGGLDLADGLAIVGLLFRGRTATCEAACDVDGDGASNVLDVLALLQFLFGRGATPAPPFPDCGPTPAADRPLACVRPPASCS